jgi:carbamoyltransferase
MEDYAISFKPAIGFYGRHDPSAVISKNGQIVFGIEEERLSRNKHAEGEFPEKAIQACLDYENIDIEDVDKILLPYRPELAGKNLKYQVKDSFSENNSIRKIYSLKNTFEDQLFRRFYPKERVESRLKSRFNASEIPEIQGLSHHRCHAASAFHPSGFQESLVLTIDGKGEYDSTVVWHGTETSLERKKTYEFPNSLGHFYGIVTEFLGFRAFNGEGKVMGLAPYGNHNEEIESMLLSRIETGAEYDVTELTEGGIQRGVQKLEELFEKSRNNRAENFSQWEKDLAHTTQKILEDIVSDIANSNLSEMETDNLALSGGVALNCKMNKKLMELEAVENIFIQPVSHDAGLPLGALMLQNDPNEVGQMSEVYLGPEYTSSELEDLLDKNKIEYSSPENLEKYVAEKLSEGNLVGWFQGRTEMGPRALGNRSILADPRTEESRDRVNRFVKHREEWRPFAPSMLENAAEDYLVNAESSPYMIKTFDVKDERKKDIEAVLHPGDDTTRPQTVNRSQNPRYHELISCFEEITGVSVLLNTSFNDHGEPIVNKPSEAIKDFFGMGLDILVIEDLVVEKER